MSRETDFSSHYNNVLSQCRDKFIARLGSDLVAMSSDLELASETSESAPLDALERLHHRLHEITGSAGMLGFEEIHSEVS